MTQEPKTQRKAATSKLEPGEHSIDRNTATERVLKGQTKVVLDWSVRLHDGRLITKRTEGTTKAGVKRRAKAKAAELLDTGANSTWKGTDRIERYLDEVTKPLVMEAGRDATVRQYLRGLNMLRTQLRGHSIASAWHYDVLADALYAIAAKHGAESARQSRTVMSKYVAQPLKRHRMINHNPLDGAALDLKKHAPESTRPDVAGRGLRPAEQERVIAWLLSADPAEGVEAPKRGRWSLADKVAKEERTIALTIFQAGTALRVSEALQLTFEHFNIQDEVLHIYVPKEIAKTGIARNTPVADPRIEEYLLARRDRASSPKAYVIGSPTDPMKMWRTSGSSSAGEMVRKLYPRLAVELDVPLMEDARTHLWRTTLSSRYSEAGVDRKDYAAMLGHDEKTNEASYTDRTDTGASVLAYRKAHKTKKPTGQSTV